MAKNYESESKNSRNYTGKMCIRDRMETEHFRSSGKYSGYDFFPLHSYGSGKWNGQVKRKKFKCSAFALRFVVSRLIITVVPNFILLPVWKIMQTKLQYTIEEKVIERAYKKLALDALVIQQGRLAEQKSMVLIFAISICFKHFLLV